MALLILDKILIHHSACTDVEVAHLGVAHLAVGGGLRSRPKPGAASGDRKREVNHNKVWSGENDVALGVVADAPPIKGS